MLWTALFYFVQFNRENYTIVAQASVSIVDEFQRENDDSTDNSASVCPVDNIILWHLNNSLLL